MFVKELFNPERGQATAARGKNGWKELRSAGWQGQRGAVGKPKGGGGERLARSRVGWVWSTGAVCVGAPCARVCFLFRRVKPNR